MVSGVVAIPSAPLSLLLFTDLITTASLDVITVGVRSGMSGLQLSAYTNFLLTVFGRNKIFVFIISILIYRETGWVKDLKMIYFKRG